MFGVAQLQQHQHVQHFAAAMTAWSQCHNSHTDIPKVILGYLYMQCRLLNLLTWRIGCLLLCGFNALTNTFPFVATFEEMPVGRRELVLQSWATSSIPQFRKARLCPSTALS